MNKLPQSLCSFYCTNVLLHLDACYMATPFLGTGTSSRIAQGSKLLLGIRRQCYFLSQHQMAPIVQLLTELSTMPSSPNCPNPRVPCWPTPAPPPAWAITGHMPGISWLLLKWRRHSSRKLAGPGEKSQMKLPGTDRRWHGSAQNLFVGIECFRLRPLDVPSDLTQALFRFSSNHCVSSASGPVAQTSGFGDGLA